MSPTAARFVRLAGPTARAMPLARALSTSAPRPNWATETVKHGLKSVDRAVSDKIVLPGLNAAEKVKEGAQALAHGKAKHKPEEFEGLADTDADTAADMAADTAKGTAKGAAKGAADRAREKL